MNQKEADKATLTAIMDRFTNWRYPRAIAIYERLQSGEKATKADLEFLDRVAEAAQEIMPIIERNPEYHEIGAKAIALYRDLTELALKNEQLKGFGKKS